jgi:hypothetical protein
LADDKKGAGRDISDLKARLGLNKGGPAGAPTGAAAPLTPAAVPRISPTGTPAAVPRVVPAPPGFPSPVAPAGPPPPDPRRDPFASGPVAAAPPAAYYGYAPIPGVDDGKPAEQIAKPKPWGLIAGLAAVAAVLLGGGFAFGRIYNARVNMNMTIDQASDIRGEVERLAKRVSTVNDLFNGSPDALKGNPAIELAEKLGELDLKAPDQERLFRTNYFFMKDLTIDRLFRYYNDTLVLYDLIGKNAKKTDADKEAIGNFVKSGGAKAEKNFGVVLDLSRPIPIAHFVEVGKPVCPKEGQTDCSPNELKFQIRTDAGGSWFDKPVKGAPGTTVIPIEKTPLFATVAAGSPDVIAVKEHLTRMRDIRLLTAKLLTDQKALLEDLANESNQRKVFTF